MEKLNSSRMASIVLGVNDGLIELTGALVGFTFALEKHNLVALTGLITGIAAALSMAASAFMQARHEHEKNPVTAAFITGVSYLIVVLFLVAPYFIFSRALNALPVMFCVALAIIAVISYYNSIYLKQSFWREFGIMFIFSIGVAAVSYGIGTGFRSFLGV